MKFQNTFIIALSVSCFSSFVLNANVGGVSGSNVFTIADGNYSEPTYKIVSAATLGNSVFSGSVDSSSNSDQSITFATGTDENNATTYPFFAVGTFKPDVQLPESNFTVSINGDGNITAVSTPTYRSNFDNSGVGFDNAPEIIVSPSDGGGDTASITAAIDSNGKVSGFTVVSGGTGYTTAAELTVVGGPHFARIANEDSTYYGRCFLITNNSRTNLTLDMSNLAQGESTNVSTYFPAGTLVEVVPAATLGNIFGSYWPLTNWTSATGWRGTTGNTVDWVYVYDPSLGGYTKYLHIAGGGLFGWYSRDKGYGVKCNNTVIYPDEAFIVARRSSGTVTLESEISFDDSPTQIYLPESGKTFIANNPFGMDLLLTEIIPSTEIHDSTTSKFRAGASDSDTDMDTITILASGTWKKYWYKSGVNSGITTTMKAIGKAGSGGSSAMTTSDLFIGSGSISAIQSSSNAAGTSIVTNYNDGNYTKLTLTGTAPGTGFTITLSDIQGYMLSDDGANELNATTLETVDTNGSGSIVYSNISGNFEIVGSGSGFVVIEKQRDVNFKSDEGSPAWSIGNVGAGYSNSSSTATWYAVGGGGTGAKGTVTTNGSGQYSSFNLTAGGSGYTSAPQIIISGGGWRFVGDTSSQDNLTVGSSDGLIIYRGATGGVKTFIQANNPTAE